MNAVCSQSPRDWYPVASVVSGDEHPALGSSRMQGREQVGSSHPNTTASDFLEARKTDPTCLTGSVRKAQEAPEHRCETPTHGSLILLHDHQE